MKRSYCVLLPIVLFGISSCNTWSQEDKDNYRHTCMASLNVPDDSNGKPKEYCNCMLEKLTAKYPNVNDMMEHMEDVINDPELQKCKDYLK